MIGFVEGKCRLCGKEDALNEGICAAHTDGEAQAYLFGFADGKAKPHPAPSVDAGEKKWNRRTPTPAPSADTVGKVIEAAKKVYKAAENMSLLDCECDPACPYYDGGDAEECICAGGVLRGDLAELNAALRLLSEEGQ